jgi:hypothetical protein
MIVGNAFCAQRIAQLRVHLSELDLDRQRGHLGRPGIAHIVRQRLAFLLARVVVDQRRMRSPQHRIAKRILHRDPQSTVLPSDNDLALVPPGST